MDRFACNGWLYITTDDHNLGTVMIRITHHQSHVPYVDISIPDDVADLVQQMKDNSAAKVNAPSQRNIIQLITPHTRFGSMCFGRTQRQS
jgi:hypothetical protein